MPGRGKILSDIISKLETIHDNAYSYEKNDPDTRISQREDIIVTCRACSTDFAVKLKNHLRSSKNEICPTCKKSENRKIYKKFGEYKTRFDEIYGNKFSYPNRLDDQLVNCSDIITIECNECGREIVREISYHLHGKGCPRCSKRRCQYTWSEYLEKFSKIHGKAYDYSGNDEKSQYKGSTLIRIKCNNCGHDKEMTIVNHLYGGSCKKCGTRKKSSTLDRYINVLNRIYNYSYDYSSNKKEDIIKTNNMIKIYCKICKNTWSDKLNKHLFEGCPKCWKNVNNIDYIDKGNYKQLPTRFQIHKVLSL